MSHFEGFIQAHMSTFWLAVLRGIVAVLTLDTVGSLASRRLGFYYGRLAPISFVFWAFAGAAASRAGTRGDMSSIAFGGLAGLCVGLIDSTLGWWISWQLGPGRIRQERSTARNIARIIFRVTMAAGFIGALGALLLSLI